MKRAKRVVLMADGKLVDGTEAARVETHGEHQGH